MRETVYSKVESIAKRTTRVDKICLQQDVQTFLDTNFENQLLSKLGRKYQSVHVVD